MKLNVIWGSIAIWVFAATVTRLAADDLPKRQEFARYEPMMNRSPFAVATAVAAPVATPNFAVDLYVANAARTPDGDLVTIASASDKNLKEYLTTKGPNKNGYSISNVEWSDRVGLTKVTISKDGQFATLTFNQALLNQPAANAAAQMQMQQNQMVQDAAPQPAGVPQPAPVPQPYNANINQGAVTPTLPTPPPRVRGVIQRNTKPRVPQPVQTQTAQPQPVIEDSQ